jgi:hypothetical protein
VLPDVPDQDVEKNSENAVVTFYHAEAADVERKNSEWKMHVVGESLAKVYKEL